MHAWLLLAAALQTSGPLVLGHDVAVHPLGLRMTIWADAPLDLTLDDVARAPEHFVASPALEPRYGFSDAAFWMHATLRADAQGGAWLMELTYPHHDDVRVHLLHASGQRDEVRLGRALPFDARALDNRRLIAPLTLVPDETAELFVRIRSESALHLGANLWQPGAFESVNADRQFGWGVYYGLLLAAVLTNLLLFFALRDRTFLLFAMFMLAICGLDMTVGGFAFQYLWPQSPTTGRVAIPFFMSVASWCGVRFARVFLRPSEHTRAPLDSALALVGHLAAAAVLLSVVIGYPARWPAAAVTMIALTVVIRSALLAVRRGYAPARLLLVALAVMSFAAVVLGLRLSLRSTVAFGTDWDVQSASLGGLVMFTLALGERVRGAERARADAQQVALDAHVEMNRRMELFNLELENRVLARTAELHEANLRKDQMVTAVSHDFRSPLATIKNNVQTLLRDLEKMEPARARRFLEAVERQEERLTTMCTQLLDLARLKDGRLEKQPLDLVTLVGQLVDGAAARAQAAGVTLTLESSTDGRMMGDPERLRQVVQNLVDNAIKFTPPGGRIRVLMDARDDGDLRLRVVDAGKGIPRDELARIFEPFHQVPDSQYAGVGSGLGLAIVRAAVQGHGGTVFAECNPDCGTTFDVRLPRGEVG